MRSWTHKSYPYLLLGLACLSAPAISPAISPAKLSGSILGLVTDGSGVPQMGATVVLFNRQDRVFLKSLTDDKGGFSFDGLAPDRYSVRVTLASFIPIVKTNILVQPGVRSLLNVSLSNLFSSIQFVYPTPEQRAIMSDDWKWVLRTATATRPVLRVLPGIDVDYPGKTHRQSAAFVGTRGVVRLSAGDGAGVSSFGSEADLGTAFALATSLYGNNHLEVVGNVGYGAQSGVPSAAFRTSYSRNMGVGSPEISVTMRQLFAPGRSGSTLVGSSLEGGMPVLRTLSVSLDDETRLSDNLTLQYGFSLDSVSFLERLNYFSPYARLNYSVGESGNVDVTYLSGNPRPELGANGVSSGPEAALQKDLNALALFPRISMREGRVRVQRGENLEVGYSHTIGSRTFRVAGYKESIGNAAVMASDPAGLYAGDMLPDLFSSSSVFNAGALHNYGYTVSMTQRFGDNLSATAMYGSVGSLTADEKELMTDSPEELRSILRMSRHDAITVRVTGTSPWTGTHVIASYQWTDPRTVVPGHIYSTQNLRPDVGLNLYIRQPLPTFSLLPWRMEATADLRNLLAQGYVPLTLSDGRQLLLVNAPRSVRGGVSFIF